MTERVDKNNAKSKAKVTNKTLGNKEIRFFGGWFRFYVDAVENPKVQRLEPALFKAWVNILCLASKNNGIIDRDDLGFRLRISDTDAQAVVEALMLRGLLTMNMVDGDRCLTPHNWAIRQPLGSSKMRMRKLRERRRNEARNVTGDACDAGCDVTRYAEVPKSNSTNYPVRDIVSGRNHEEGFAGGAGTSSRNFVARTSEPSKREVGVCGTSAWQPVGDAAARVVRKSRDGGAA